MLKIKPLRPTLREKKRYIVYQVFFSDKEGTEQLSMFDTQKLLLSKLNELLGVFQSSIAGIMPIKVDEKTKKGILKVNHKTVDLIRSCFVMIKSLGNEDIIIKTVGVSGILKKVQEKYFLNSNN